MTRSIKVLGQMLKTRSRGINQIIIINLAIVAVAAITFGFGRLTRMQFNSIVAAFTALAIGIGFIHLAQQQEKTWTANSWRLVPIANWKLFGLSSIANVLCFLYLTIVQGVVVVAISLIARTARGKVFTAPLSQWPPIIIFLIILLVMLWSLISLVHLFRLTLVEFLPSIRQKMVQLVIDVAALGIMWAVYYWAAAGLEAVLRPLNLNFSVSMTFDSSTGMGMSAANLTAVWQSSLIVAVNALIFGALCCYLLSHWVETKQDQQIA